MQLNLRYFVFVLLILLFPIISQPGNAKVYLVDFDEDQAEFLMLQAVNSIRYSEGLTLLVPDDKLNISCGRHAMDMARRDFFDHYSLDGTSPADRARSMGVANPISENIGITRTFGRDLYQVVDLLMEGFLNSPEHRVNILDPDITHIGIGFYQDMDDMNHRLESGRDPSINYQGFGTILVVQEFYKQQVELIEPSPYSGYMKPGEFITLQLDFIDDVNEAFLRIASNDDPNRAYELPMSKAERSFRVRFAIEDEGEFTIGIYANSSNADWYYREQGQLNLTVKSYLY